MLRSPTARASERLRRIDRRHALQSGNRPMTIAATGGASESTTATIIETVVQHLRQDDAHHRRKQRNDQRLCEARP